MFNTNSENFDKQYGKKKKKHIAFFKSAKHRLNSESKRGESSLGVYNTSECLDPQFQNYQHKLLLKQ